MIPLHFLITSTFGVCYALVSSPPGCIFITCVSYKLVFTNLFIINDAFGPVNRAACQPRLSFYAFGPVNCAACLPRLSFAFGPVNRAACILVQ